METIHSLGTTRYHSRLAAGKHRATEGQVCGMELLSLIQGQEFSDTPDQIRCWDLRPLNDIQVPDTVRWEVMEPVLYAYQGSMDWTIDRQLAVGRALVVGLVRELIALLPGLTQQVREACLNARTPQEALRAAEAAATTMMPTMWATMAAFAACIAVAAADCADAAAAAARLKEAALAASEAAKAASESAWWAANETAMAACEAAWIVCRASDVAAKAAREQVFRTACRVWVAAAAAGAPEASTAREQT